MHIPVWGQVNETVGVGGIVAAGQRSIEHAEDIFSVEYKDNPKTPTDAFVKTANELLAPDVWVCPTLIAFGTVTHELADLRSVLRQTGMQYLPAWAQDEWSPARIITSTILHWPDGFFAAMVPSQGIGRSHARAWRAPAGRTDAAVPVALPGFSLPDELELLVEVGLSPYEALRSSTCEAALFLTPQKIGVHPGRKVG